MWHDDVNRAEPDSGVFALVEMARSALGQLSHEQCLRAELEIARRTKRNRAKFASRHLHVLAMLALFFALIGAALAVFRHVIWPDALSYVVEIGSANETPLTQPSGTSAAVLRYPPSSRTKLGAAPK